MYKKEIKKPVVEVVNKLTEKQITDMRIAEIEELVNKQAEEILELRTSMLEIKKKLIEINKTKNNKNKA